MGARGKLVAEDREKELVGKHKICWNDGRLGIEVFTMKGKWVNTFSTTCFLFSSFLFIPPSYFVKVLALLRETSHLWMLPITFFLEQSLEIGHLTHLSLISVVAYNYSSTLFSNSSTEYSDFWVLILHPRFASTPKSDLWRFRELPENFYIS